MTDSPRATGDPGADRAGLYAWGWPDEHRAGLLVRVWRKVRNVQLVRRGQERPISRPLLPITPFIRRYRALAGGRGRRRLLGFRAEDGGQEPARVRGRV